MRGIARVVRRRAIHPSIPPIENDDFFTWLIFCNAGMLQPGNMDAFNHAIANLPTNDPIIEIGSFCGLSTNVVSYLKQKHGAPNKFFTCDRWIFENGGGPMLGKSRISHVHYREFVRDTFIRNVRMFSGDDSPHTIELFSDEFFQAWEANQVATDVYGRDVRLGGPISFCYVDGNHTYDFAKRDFTNTDKYLVRGGFVLLDDSAPGSVGEAPQVAQDIIETGRYAVVAQTPNYLFKKL